MKVVYKYEVGLLRKSTHFALKGEVICAGPDASGIPCVWIEGHPGVTEQRSFEVFGTGNPIPDNSKAHGSYLNEPFVWHIYEVDL